MAPSNSTAQQGSPAHCCATGSRGPCSWITESQYITTVKKPWSNRKSLSVRLLLINQWLDKLADVPKLNLFLVVCYFHHMLSQKTMMIAIDAIVMANVVLTHAHSKIPFLLPVTLIFSLFKFISHILTEVLLPFSICALWGPTFWTKISHTRLGFRSGNKDLKSTSILKYVKFVGLFFFVFTTSCHHVFPSIVSVLGFQSAGPLPSHWSH